MRREIEKKNIHIPYRKEFKLKKYAKWNVGTKLNRIYRTGALSHGNVKMVPRTANMCMFVSFTTHKYNRLPLTQSRLIRGFSQLKVKIWFWKACV